MEVTRRPESTGDFDFLLELYASTREEELADLGWGHEQKATFVQQQFEARRNDWGHRFPRAERSIIEVDGQPAGRLLVVRENDSIHVIDIALVAKHRGRGTGGALLREILDEARESGRRVCLSVERSNRAQNLYRRLGFLCVAEEGFYLQMEWTLDGRAGTG